MNAVIQHKKTTLPFLAIAVLACSGLLPQAQAACQEGCDNSLFNAFLGDDALISNTIGAGNTALGWRSLFSNIDASFNTGVGGGALVLNNGSSNTAVGAAALLLNTTASNNTAVGTDTLVNNAADENTAIGFFALFANTTGGTLEPAGTEFDVGPNTAIGSHALESNVDGSGNTAVGYNALHSQVSGDVAAELPQLAVNTAVGFEALANVTGSATGENCCNTAYGYRALFGLTDGLSNTALGTYAGSGLTSGHGNIFIGAGPATATEDYHTYIGNIQFTGVSGAGTDTVTIDLTTGLLGILTSSRRYKEDIKPMNKASEALYRLKPVTYRYKKDVDKTQSLAFGLIAEEVAEVNPDLVANNAQGLPESVHYEMVNAMLLNEFLKEHCKVEQLEVTLARQQTSFESKFAYQQKQIDALTVGLQKVSAQLELNKPAPHAVVDND